MIHYHWRPLLAGLTILILSSLVPATPLQAQQSQGSITGKLTDQKGNPLAQVIVTLPELRACPKITSDFMQGKLYNSIRAIRHASLF